MTIKVFIADDHGVIRDGLRLLMEAENDITVVGVASDGRSAVRQVKELQPDVVIIDIAMPELNGIDATLQIREASPGTRVIVLSMYDTQAQIRGALKSGAGGYLLKESAGPEIVAAVRALADGRRYLCSRITGFLIDDYLDGLECRNPGENLSPREREILQAVVEGRSSAEIADMLCLSPKTIETYRSRMMLKLNINNIPELVKFAIKNNIISI